MTESLRARWFFVYALVFGSLVVLLLIFGLTESRIMIFFINPTVSPILPE